ncbi:MAG: hypothetical protein U0L98_06190 [Clostridia bacterium]|nr:hypothetical protein [Clostridia bacterium]
MKNISLDDIKSSGKKLKVGMIILLIPIIIFTVLYLLANIYYGFFAMLFISIILILLIARGNKMIKNPEIFLQTNYLQTNYLQTNYSRREPKYRKNLKIKRNKKIRNIPNMNWEDGKFIIDGEEFYPGYTFEDFKKTHFYNNQDGISIIQLKKMIDILEHKYIVTLSFWINNNLHKIILDCADDITPEETPEEIHKKYGLSKKNQFEWGSIKSSYDPRSDVSSIAIIYKDYKINRKIVDKLSFEMKEILEEELKAGNEIVETFQGGFTNTSSDHIFIFLKYPFKAKIHNNLKGITYRELNDRHYWKAEYTDENNHQTLACNF